MIQQVGTATKGKTCESFRYVRRKTADANTSNSPDWSDQKVLPEENMTNRLTWVIQKT